MRAAPFPYLHPHMPMLDSANFEPFAISKHISNDYQHSQRDKYPQKFPN
jgi:hypothetical protein